MIRHIVPLVIAAAALTGAATAETTITLEGVHNCCKGCANGITKAAEGMKDVTVTPDGRTVTVTAKTKSAANKAVEAIKAAGYFGASDADLEPAKTSASSAAASKKLTSATVTGAHLCCGKCVTAVSDAVKTVPGITNSNIVSKSKTFTVEGEFTAQELIAALNKAGFHGTVQ